MTSMPAARAARTASTAVMPQSHVMMSPAPRRRAAARPAGPKSYPSRSRCGTNAWARPPTLESTRVSSAAADPLVATQQAGAHGRGGALALRERPLALGGDLLALAGERLTQRGLSRPHFFECPLGLRSFALRFRDRIAGPHELGLLFGEHRAGEVQLRHEGRGFLRAPHPLEPLAPLLLHG